MEYFIIDQNSIVIDPSGSQSLAGSTPTEQDNNSGDKADHKWTANQTKLLIDFYKKYKPKVGSFEIKTIKRMWQKIASEVSNYSKVTILPHNCENRWRVLDRNYKKYIEQKNSTGQGRAYFEYAEEMEELFGKKKSIKPQLLLSTETISVPDHSYNKENSVENNLTAKTSQDTEKTCNADRKIIKKRKTSVIEQIRQDRLAYHTKRLQQEERKIEEIKKRNELIIERNNILSNQHCCKNN